MKGELMPRREHESILADVGAKARNHVLSTIDENAHYFVNLQTVAEAKVQLRKLFKGAFESIISENDI
jgi:hypothetical protein